MNLYLKYRPKTISELDLTSVREGLQRVVESDKMAHAYLFTGPRGAGKTSSARILARVVNCEENAKKLGEPCNKCSACTSILDGSAIDVLEIDAASNRGIDDVRELKEKIGLSPSSLRKKVYIIDEVHMMTTEAFNALLKTLEEPPAHALFILCTTEAHKVPETIASRCSRILFTKATPAEMTRSLSRVVKGEGAKVSEEALELLASSVDGSFRDGVKILDQVLDGNKEIGLAEMEQVVHGASGYSTAELVQAMIKKEVRVALDKFSEATSQGIDLTHLLISMIGELRREVLAGELEYVELIKDLDEVACKLSTSPVPEILVEMVIISWCSSNENPKPQNPNPKQATNTNIKKETKISVEETKKVDVVVEEEDEVVEQKPVQKKVTKSAPVEKSVFAGTSRELWRKMLVSMNGDSYSLGALLAKARPGVMQGDELVIEVQHGFHKEQIMMEKYRGRIEKLIGEVVGQPMRINCVVVETKELAPSQSEPSLQTEGEDDNILDEAVEIFS